MSQPREPAPRTGVWKPWPTTWRTSTRLASAELAVFQGDMPRPPEPRPGSTGFRVDQRHQRRRVRQADRHRLLSRAAETHHQAHRHGHRRRRFLRRAEGGHDLFDARGNFRLNARRTGDPAGSRGAQRHRFSDRHRSQQRPDADAARNDSSARPSRRWPGQRVSRGDLAKWRELVSPLAETSRGARTARVVSGYLEGSGVQPTTEMVELIETTRAIEVNVAMMQPRTRCPATC